MTCSHATCPALSTGNLHFVVFSFTLSFWMLHGTSPGERSCPTTGPATGATSPFHSVVHHSGSNLLHCCYGHQLELDKKKAVSLFSPSHSSPVVSPYKAFASRSLWLYFFLLLSSRVDFFIRPPLHLGLHLCNGAHQSYFQFGSLVLGSPI